MTHTSLGKEQLLSQGCTKEWEKLREACWAFLSPVSLDMYPGLGAES